jgi:cation-transporting P-type ATPase 13A2
VPGDVVAIGAGPVYCDMVILTGEAVVDESSLTGESMPVVKTAVDPTNPQVYNAIHHHKHHSIFAGTAVTENAESTSENRHKNLALVVRTGSHTMKGELLRDMLFSPPKKFKFDVEVHLCCSSNSRTTTGATEGLAENAAARLASRSSRRRENNRICKAK